ncbi:MAG: LuxR family transcriptional regulator, partial [Gordonibacter sp.]
LFGPVTGGYLAYVVSIAARFAFCVITQMFFSRYAASGRATAVQSFGLGWIFVHLGDFLGVVVVVLVQAELAASAIALDQVAAVSIAVLVVATMFVLNRKSFSLEARSDNAET